MGKMHRSKILLDPEQHNALAEIARRNVTSISAVVRTVLQVWLDERQQDERLRVRLEALDTIRAHRQELLDRRDGKPLNFDPAGLLERVRKEHGDANA